MQNCNGSIVVSIAAFQAVDLGLDSRPLQKDLFIDIDETYFAHVAMLNTSGDTDR